MNYTTFVIVDFWRSTTGSAQRLFLTLLSNDLDAGYVVLGALAGIDELQGKSCTICPVLVILRANDCTHSSYSGTRTSSPC